MSAELMCADHSLPDAARRRFASAPAASLAAISILRELPHDILASLARRCAWRRFGAGQTIFHYGENRRAVFFVVQGRACALYHSAGGREVRFGHFDASDVFGEFAAIDGAPHSADVVCVADALVAVMPAEVFREVLHANANVAVAVLRRVTGIARAISRRIVEFSTLPVRHRVHAELLRLARIEATDRARREATIVPAPTNAEIASRISTHREAVSRELAELMRHGLIARRGGALVLRDVPALASMVEEALEEAPIDGCTP